MELREISWDLKYTLSVESQWVKWATDLENCFNYQFRKWFHSLTFYYEKNQNISNIQQNWKHVAMNTCHLDSCINISPNLVYHIYGYLFIPQGDIFLIMFSGSSFIHLASILTLWVWDYERNITLRLKDTERNMRHWDYERHMTRSVSSKGAQFQ